MPGVGSGQHRGRAGVAICSGVITQAGLILWVPMKSCNTGARGCPCCRQQARPAASALEGARPGADAAGDGRGGWTSGSGRPSGTGGPSGTSGWTSRGSSRSSGTGPGASSGTAPGASSDDDGSSNASISGASRSSGPGAAGPEDAQAASPAAVGRLLLGLARAEHRPPTRWLLAALDLLLAAAQASQGPGPAGCWRRWTCCLASCRPNTSCHLFDGFPDD